MLAKTCSSSDISPSDSGQDTKTVAMAQITLAPNYEGFLLQKQVVNDDRCALLQ